ncbi:phage integrase N-terminal domain-containing protein [Ferribacterium limneticum]|uniref:phage integrase N-terminal domain-containing protein n=1 Tax=Ferribacterium limneticum TaxID=76259 RepID=UPI001CFB5209|nr:phage integrase N-terminal domain-containing protein [Ferribacterium limneticum]UCV20795.1 integrase domain-containing protein [Ferribacterium limneticum]
MSHLAADSSLPHRPHSAGRATHKAQNPRDWSGLNAPDILARYRPGHAAPMNVLEVLLKLFNERHTARMKTVSHKTRQERADFLRRFFRDLQRRAGFKTLPDPRNLGQKHIQAMVQIWREDKLKPATIQTYLSFLRGLAKWLGKNGFVRSPAHYGLEIDEYQRHEAAERDKSWSAQGVDVEALIDKVCVYDPYVGASLRLIRAFGLRRKESVMLRPNECIVPFESTGLAESEKLADRYVWIRQGAKNGRQRFVPLSTPQRVAAIEYAQSVVWGTEAHMGDPANDLKRNLRRFDYVLDKFGITARELGITAHGLRHEALIDEFVACSGQQPPVRGGGILAPEVEAAARRAVARLAGHERQRASNAYCGKLARRARSCPPTGDPDIDTSDET